MERILDRRLHESRNSPPDEQLGDRSEEHTSELQSLTNLVCRLLLEKKNKRSHAIHAASRYAGLSLQVHGHVTPQVSTETQTCHMPPNRRHADVRTLDSRHSLHKRIP